MACVILQKDCKHWFAELNVDMEKILEITRYILNLYEMWKNFDEKKEVHPLLTKMPKPKIQPVGPGSQSSQNGNDMNNSQVSNGNSAVSQSSQNVTGVQG